MPPTMADPLKLAALMSTAIAAVPNSGSVAWRHEMERIIARGHTAAYIAGVAERLGVKPDIDLISQQRLSRAERAEIKRLVDVQLQYFAGFVKDLPNISTTQIAARADMYSGASRTTYYATRWGDWQIPDQLLPGNAQCLSRCRCAISVQDNGDGTGVLTRVMGGEAIHCTECPALAGDHPVRRRSA